MIIKPFLILILMLSLSSCTKDHPVYSPPSPFFPNNVLLAVSSYVIMYLPSGGGSTNVNKDTLLIEYWEIDRPSDSVPYNVVAQKHASNIASTIKKEIKNYKEIETGNLKLAVHFWDLPNVITIEYYNYGLASLFQ